MIPVVIGKPLPVHLTYPASAQARAFWRWSDRCGFDYPAGKDASGRPILPRHEREPDEEPCKRYTRRLAQAVGRPYVRSIISRYNDHVCRHAVKRPDAGGEYEALVSDANGAGTSLQSLMRSVLRQAQVEGASYLLADSLRMGTYESAAQAIADGQRSIIRQVSPDAVIDWRDDSHGNVAAGLMILVDDFGNKYAWNVDATGCQRIELAQEAVGSTYMVVSVGPIMKHSAGGCPLVRMSPIVGATSQAEPIAESQKKICNFESWLCEELQASTFTVPVILGCDPETIKAPTVGAGMLMAIPPTGGTSPSLGRIAADPTQADSLRQSLDREVRELYRAAGLSAGNPTEVGAPESGVAKAFAFNEIEATLSALADAAEDAENRAVMMAAGWGGWSYPGDCDWPDNFAPVDLAADLEFVVRLGTAPDVPAVLKTKAWRDFANRWGNLTAEEQAALSQQLDDMAEDEEEREESPFLRGTSRTGS